MSSDALLERMMPKGIFEQLKAGNVPGAEEFESVTIFFSDITNFTLLSSEATPTQMMHTLNELWQEYDKIAKKYGLYKV